jgi:hypothetical protein
MATTEHAMTANQLVDPDTRSITVYRSRSEIRVLAPGDLLGGEDVVPGFGIPVVEVFST